MAHPLSAAHSERTVLDEALSNCRSAFVTVGAFSLVINVLVLAAPLYMFQVLDRVLSSGSLETLALLTAMAIAAVLVMSVLDTLRASITTRIGCWLNDALGPVYLESAARAQSVGADSGAQPLRDLAQLQNFIANQGLSAFFDSPWVPIFVIIIWLMHPLLGAVALTAAVLLFALSLANDFATRPATEAATRAHHSADRVAEVTIRNAEVVRAMGLLPAMRRHWRGFNSEADSAMLAATEIGGIILGATKFVRYSVQIIILGCGAWLVVTHDITTGAMIAASILLGRALAPVELAIGGWKSFVSAKLAYAGLQAHIEAYPPEPARTRLPAPSGRLAVQELTYVAPYSGQVILNAVSFSIEPGEALAIIGASGAGKSTLCRLLVGLAEPAAGEVRLDESDLRNWNPVQLGRHIGYLPQDVELFPGSVRKNIARMSEAADEAVVAASMSAHAHRMILRLPQGYDTEIGEGGVRLSGGQRQRVGLARAVFGDPRLIVLDEPNANLDQAGEAALGRSLAELKQKGCALVIVGHRPSTIAHANKILILQDGCVSMFGSRDDVIEAVQELSEHDALHDAFPAGALAAGTRSLESRQAGGGP